jgi:hypothetical protein
MTWMKHSGHGGLADLPETPFWLANGWEPTDERPAEPDPYRDPPPLDEPENTEAPDASVPGLSAAETEKPATPAKTKKTEADRG